MMLLVKNNLGHFIFECTNLSEKRTSLLPKHLIERPNIIKFKNFMTSERKPILRIYIGDEYDRGMEIKTALRLETNSL
jgi:hypothetical protein